MRRRLVIALASTAAAPGALGQAKPRRIGYLVGGSQEAFAAPLDRLREGLRRLGYEEGRAIVIEYKFAQEKPERLPGLAAELVKSGVDLIVAHGTPETQAAKGATSSIPIVMLATADPVGAGLVSNLSRPGGNITGLSNLDVGLAAKRLELMKDILPKLSRIAVLRNPANPSGVLQYRDTQAAAKTFGITPQLYDVHSPAEVENAFKAMPNAKVGAVTAMADPVFLSWRKQIAQLAIAQHLPSYFARNENVEAGGLISYGPSNAALYAQGAGFVDRIFRGAKPGDLAIEQPSKFDLVINVSTAKAIGVTIPKAVEFRADRLIQ